MAQAAYVIPQFLGGELSLFAQGRFDKPDYRVSMRTCLNSFPVEIGAWTRRPGTRHAGTTRGGVPGRTIKFDFQQSNAATLEFTDGFLRFRNGATLITTNDTQTVVAVSAANPAVVQVANVVNWATGDTLIFAGPSTPMLENRQFIATKIDGTHFSIADPLTGLGIDGSTLGVLAASATAARVQELATIYSAQSWQNLRAVQAEKTDILLTPNLAPQALTVTISPTAGVGPVFAIAPAIFNDGPYLDPFINGVQATPSAKSGIISLTLSFPPYSAVTAYAKSAFVTSGGINYISLVDQNVGNTPASSPTFWQTTNAGAAIGPNGFQGSDIGRLVRLFSEPAPWASGSTYSAGNVVSYNPSGLPGAATYWQSLTSSNSGHSPGADLTNWQIVPQGAAIWTWGKIAALSNVISRTAGSTVGNMTFSGGLAAAFDGVFSKPFASSSEFFVTNSGSFPQGTIIGLGGAYVGKNYSSPQTIKQAIVYPSSDQGFVFGSYKEFFSGNNLPFSVALSVSLRAKQTAPISPSDGTLLGTTGFIGNTVSSVTINSSDQATAWNYVWIEIEGQAPLGAQSTSYTLVAAIGQISFFSPNSTGTGDGANVEILGPPLLYTNPVVTWRLGVFSDTTGWPTCGIYNDGRLYLGGAVGNRFDACVSNGILGGTINFAPTDQYGVVAASNAISYTFNSNGVNPVLWMDADLQGIKMGTQAGEWLVVAPTAGSIAPNNISARNVTGHGSKNIQPCRTEHTTIFVQRFARKLLEYFPDVYSGKFSAPNIADKAEHLTSAGVAELAYVNATTPIIWGRDTLGALFGITYKRDTLASAQPPTYYGWHHHALGSGRIIESISSGPSVDGSLDTLTLVTNDPVTNIRHVEILTDAADELSPLATSWFLDNAVNPTSVSSTPFPSLGAPYGGATLNGLWHLNGKTVQVFAGGLDCGDPGESGFFSDFVVSNGSVFVPFGDGVTAGSGRGLFTQDFFTALPLSQIVVGFTYNSDGQLMRMIAQADTGARNGPAFGVLSRGHRYAVKLVNTLGLSVGTVFGKLQPALFKTAGVKDIPALTTFTGIHQDSLQDDYGYDNAVCWRVSRPFPATIVAIGSNLATQDQ